MEVLKIVLILGISWAAVIWGVNLCHQRGTWFLAGWNTMRKEKRETYNEKEMCRLYGRCVVFCGVGVIQLLYGSVYDRDALLRARRVEADVQLKAWLAEAYQFAQAKQRGR